MGASVKGTCAALVHRVMHRVWYDARHPLRYPLLPLSAATASVAAARRAWYARVKPAPLPLPVIVVGNLTVGGAGKTPLSIEIARYLGAAGYKPGVASRGYGGRCKTYPRCVSDEDDPGVVGDEPLLIKRKSACPVVVDPDRRRAVACLAEQGGVDVAVCDDGLQHYRLHRDIEIAVIDGRTLFGNGLLLPAGPLREPRARLASTDFIVVNGTAPIAGAAAERQFSMRLQPVAFENLATGERRAPGDFAGRKVHACAGIAHPRRFFDTLRGLGMNPRTHVYPDHHRYRRRDLDFGSSQPVILTEKDAVKCRRFVGDEARGGAWSNTWALQTEAVLEDGFWDALLARLKSHGTRLHEARD